MKWTNKYNLPNRVIKVLTGNRVDKQPSLDRLSVTDLINEPLMRILYIKHWDKIVRDYSDMLIPVQGIALHSRYEMYASDDEDAEIKLEIPIDGITLVGMADSVILKVIIDVKQTGVYTWKYKVYKWTEQLNTYAWMWYQKGIKVEELIIDIWCRDWKQSCVTWKDYPPIPYMELKLDLWPLEKQEKYVKDQVKKHLDFPVYNDITQYKTPCSDKTRGKRWEGYKGKNKTPTKVADTEQEVVKWSKKQKFETRIEKSSPVFCERYCKARNVCPFVKEK